MKRRLVGAVVLIALGVIFIPMILDGSGRSGRVSVDVEIPPAPVYSVPDRLPAPTPPASSEGSGDVGRPSKEASAKAIPSPEAAAPADTAQPKRAVTESAPVERPKEPELAAPSAWVVQVGSFEDEDKALALRDKLRKGGFPAFVEPYRNETQKKLYRVRVGPELKRELAEQTLARLKREQGMDGLVVSHP